MTNASISDATIDGWPNINYQARRYNKIVDSPVSNYERQLIGRPHLGMNANQTLEFIDNDGNGGVRTTYQVNPNSTWSNWTALTGAPGVASTPVLGRNLNGTQQIFAPERHRLRLRHLPGPVTGPTRSV
ncbi:hypothetical protein [Kitasatospora griseola]|uniref:hypothetical protein n=1 Tax=Kitasatospora griseola TaxID=2064 RepID=UPI00380870CD